MGDAGTLMRAATPPCLSLYRITPAWSRADLSRAQMDMAGEQIAQLPLDATYHKHLGQYLPSVFDVAHDHGVQTALLAGKEKFVLMERSWNRSTVLR